MTQGQNKENLKTQMRTNFSRGLLLFLCACFTKFTFAEIIQNVEQVFGQNMILFWNFFVTQLSFIENYQRQPERKQMLYGIIDMVFTPAMDRIPQDLWKRLLNEIVENITRRKSNKSGLMFLKDDEDEMASMFGSAAVSGNKSNFQKLSFLNQKVDYLKDAPEEEKYFVMKCTQQFSDTNLLQNFIMEFINPQLQQTVIALFQ